MKSYVPRGYVSTADAVERIFEARHPDLAASASARDADMRRLYGHYRAEFPGHYPPPATIMDATRLRDAVSKRRAIIAGALDARSALNSRRDNSKPVQPVGTFGEEDLAQLHELDRTATEQRRLENAAAIELRAALAEGDLVAVLNHEEMPPIPKFRWCEDDGLIIVQKARLPDQLEGTLTQKVERAALIKEADLVGWLRSILKMAAKRGGGRPPKYDWEPVLEKLRNRLMDDGAPAFGDGGQAELERFVADQFPIDDCPAESVIRPKVRDEIRAFRQSLNSQGR